MSDFNITKNSIDQFNIVLDVGVAEVVTSDYERLNNLPSINYITLKGNRNLAETPLTNLEISSIFN